MSLFKGNNLSKINGKLSLYSFMTISASFFILGKISSYTRAMN